jgi:fanconi anemia group I protein
VLEYEDKLKEMSGFVGLVSSADLGSAFVKAIAPIIFSQAAADSLRNGLIMSLRKSMFSRDETPRLTAASCFGTLFKLTKTASMRRQSQITSTLPLEILSFVGRCLTQQREVREAVYTHFHNPPHFRKEVAEVFLQHLLHRYAFDTANISEMDRPAFLDTSSCLDRKRDDIPIVEPLHLLIQCLASVSDQTGPTGCSIAEQLFALATRASKCELEAFELDKSSEFDLTSPTGWFNHQNAYVLLTVLEVLAEFCLSQRSKAADRLIPVPGIFKVFFDLRAVIKDKSAKEKASKKKSADDAEDEDASAGSHPLPKRRISALLRPSGLSSTGIRNFVSLLFAADCPQWECVGALKQYILATCIAHIRDMHKRSTMVSDEMSPQVEFCVAMAPYLWKTFADTWETIPDTNQRKDGRPIPSLALEGFLDCLKLSFHWMSAKSDRDEIVHKLFAFISEPSNSRKKPNLIHEFMNQVWEIIPMAADKACVREVEILLEVLARLHPLLPEDLLQQHITNATAFTMMENVAPAFARKAMRLFWSMQLRTDETLDCLRQFAVEIKTLWGGNSAEDTAHPASPDLVLVSSKTSPHLMSELIDMLDSQLDRATASLQWMKKRRSALQRLDTGAGNDEESIESGSTVSAMLQRVCSRLYGLAQCLDVMLTTALRPIGVDGILKCVLHFYRILSTVCKEARISPFFGRVS